MKHKLTPHLKLCMALLAAFLPLSARAEEVASEAVKALYILKLRTYVTVSEPPRVPQTICYYEKPGIELNESVGQLIAKYNAASPDRGGHPLSVKWLQAIRDFSGCDILYIPGQEEAVLTSALTTLGNSSTLTISSIPQFIYKGGMIGFLLDDNNHVKMEGNMQNLQGKKVRVDAQILEIMQHVIQ